MNSFLFALQFLTLIPVRLKVVDEPTVRFSLVYFPVVGLLLGVILAGIYNLLLMTGLAALSVDIILVVSLIILTGGLHLDGLADTADALVSRKSKDEILTIMRDSRIGAMGVLALAGALLLKVAFLYSITPADKIPALLIMCVLSRWALVLVMFLFPYARPEGKAKIFTQQVNLKIYVWATAVTLAFVAILWQWKGLVIFGITSFSVYTAARFISNRIGGITGDVLGLINELAELTVLFSLCVL